MINIEQIYGRELKVSYYDENGDIRISKIPIPDSERYRWQECESDDPYRVKGMVSHENRPVKRVKAKSLDKYRIYEFMNNKISKDFLKQIHAFNPPKKWFMDIETEVLDDEFPDVDNPKCRVLSNSFCNQKGDVFITTIPHIYTGKKLTAVQKENIGRRVNDYFKDLRPGDQYLIKEYKVKFKDYDNEALMLSDLFYNYIPKMPLITGWNFHKFDWMYLVNRARGMQLRPEKSSPSGTFYNFNIKDKWNPNVKYKIELPYHRGIVDYMMIYEKWDTSIKLKSSTNLDFVANEVLGLSKVHYSGTLMDLYRDDIETYLFYNAVDTILVALIDEKLQTFNTMQKLSCEGRVSLNDSQFASVIIESLFSDVFFKRNKVFVRKDFDNSNEEKYAGGFVFEPTKGIFDDVVIFDYESMFPTIMMFANTGVDSLLGKTHDGGKTYIDKFGQTHTINREDHIWMASGAVYSKKEDSVMRKVVSELFDERITAKKAGAIIGNEIAELEDMLKNMV